AKFSGGVHGFGTRLYKAIAAASPGGTPGADIIADVLGVAIRHPTGMVASVMVVREPDYLRFTSVVAHICNLHKQLSIV
ncbi:hypothetical protein SARC_17557, partial [Sphaeroforma arctica JP610]